VGHLPKVDPGFKTTSSTVEGAGEPGYCYQCGACVAECPAARKSLPPPRGGPRGLSRFQLLPRAVASRETGDIWVT
ncbi:MAG: hypothetical protein KKE43_08540, partial [Actinobacteria bacterium]|nr:hypothetical protein [Actinomycetota bacterium]